MCQIFDIQGVTRACAHKQTNGVFRPVESGLRPSWGETPPPSKARLAKNLYTNPERMTSCFRVNWVWSEWVHLYNQHMILLMFLFVHNFSLPLYAPIFIYRVIRKSLRDFRPLRYSSRDCHAEGEHVNRGRDMPSF